MLRFFFDVSADGAVEYDYCGRLVTGLSQALQTANLIAGELASTPRAGRSSIEVQIRDDTGSFFYPVPVKMVDAGVGACHALSEMAAAE